MAVTQIHGTSFPGEFLTGNLNFFGFLVTLVNKHLVGVNVVPNKQFGLPMGIILLINIPYSFIVHLIFNIDNLVIF